MRNTMKKVFAVILAAALCLSFAGCYDENNTWAAKKGGDTLPIGGYIYYLYSAYSEAMGKVSSEDEVLKADIEDFLDESKSMSGEEWVKARAMNYLNSYYFISDKFAELGLELTEDELSNAQSSTDSMWTYYKATFEDNLGVAKESFHQAFSLYNVKYRKVMEALYGEGGEMEVPEDELKTYFTENYYNYEYFYASLTKNDEDGNSVDMTDEEKADTKSKLDGYVDKINTGSLTVEAAATEYATEALGSADQSSYQAPSPTLADNVSATIKDAIADIDDNTAVLAETTTGYYVIRKLSIADKFAETTADETQKINLIANMKGEDFADYVTEQAASYTSDGLEINEKALNRVKLSSLVTDSNRKGTSSASSAAGSDTSSAAESSAASEAE